MVRLGLSVCLALLVFSGFAWGDTIGTTNSGNCLPFGCAVSNDLTVYQQAYFASAFSGPLSFNDISFFQYRAGAMDSATYSINFSYTNAVYPMNAATPGENVGADNTYFGTYTLSGNVPTTLSLVGNTFSYDPTQGNLLMTMYITPISTAASGYGYFDSNFTAVDTAREYWESNGSVSWDGSGLITDFSTAPVATPEPASWTLTGAGILLLGGLFYRTDRRPVRTAGF